MQQMAGNMGILNPFVFNQFAAGSTAYGSTAAAAASAYAAAQYAPALNSQFLTQQQQAALVAATTGQAAGSYISPMTAAAAAQIAPSLNGLTNAVVSPTSGKIVSNLSSCSRLYIGLESQELETTKKTS
jgi:CUG-BP- and ETR3-like factor